MLLPHKKKKTQAENPTCNFNLRWHHNVAPENKNSERKKHYILIFQDIFLPFDVEHYRFTINTLKSLKKLIVASTAAVQGIKLRLKTSEKSIFEPLPCLSSWNLLQVHRCKLTNRNLPQFFSGGQTSAEFPFISKSTFYAFPENPNTCFRFFGCARFTTTPAHRFAVWQQDVPLRLLPFVSPRSAAAAEQNVGVVGAGGCCAVSCVLMQTKSCFRDAWANRRPCISICCALICGTRYDKRCKWTGTGSPPAPINPERETLGNYFRKEIGCHPLEIL